MVITSSPLNGGTYHYALSVLNALRDYNETNQYFVFHDFVDFPKSNYSLRNWWFHHLNPTENRIVKVYRLLSVLGLSRLKRRAQGRFRALTAYQLDLVICTSTTLAAWYCGLKYISVVHDIWHRRRLPGVSPLSEPFRDLTTKTAAKEASLVLVESRLGKVEVMEAYAVDGKRIEILPTGPAAFIWNKNTTVDKKDVISQYGLSCKKYVFYPGWFSVAKNQKRIIEAVSILRNRFNEDVHALLTSPLNDYAIEMKSFAKHLKVDDLIHIEDCVPDEDMAYLYENAMALVMASYIGPTNMPIWEAFVSGCPVISSNAGEMPDQVGEAGLLFNPDDANELAKCIYAIHSDDTLSRKLVSEGRSRAELVSPKEFSDTLARCIAKACE